MPETPVAGRLCYLKIGDGADPEVFSYLCGTKSFKLNIENSTVDTTVPDCTDPSSGLNSQEIYSVQKVSMSVEGLFMDGSTVVDTFLTAIRGRTAINVQAFIDGYGTYEGAAIITSKTLEGEMTSAVDFSVEISFTGTATFTAAA